MILDLLPLAKTTEIAAAFSALALARRKAEHWPAAVALVLLAAIPLLRGPLKSALHVSAQPWPVYVYADGAAQLATSATVAGLALVVAVQTQHRVRALALAVLGWMVGSIALASLYPSPLVTGARLQRVYYAADLLTFFVAAAALARWADRGLAAKRSPNGASMVALSLWALQGVIAFAPFGPWRGDVFGSDFSGIQVCVAAVFGCFTCAQLIAWRVSCTPR